jgi:hypothetical protein
MPPVDPLDQLRKLASLKADGIINEQEYEKMKSGLLQRANSTQTSSQNSAHIRAELPGGIRRVTSEQVKECHTRLISSERVHAEHAAEQSKVTRQARRLQRSIHYFKMVARFRSSLNHFAFGAITPIIIGTLVGVLLGVMLAGSFYVDWMFAGGSVVGLLFLILSIHLFSIPADELLSRYLSRRTTRLLELETASALNQPLLTQSKSVLDKVRREYDSLVADFQSRRNSLLSIDWSALRSIQFESFLRDVFENLGFAVSMTKASGDQGVDLVAAKNGLKLAIQAKGYDQMVTVGNSAVQEAHTGMAYYRCDACAVITQSSFTNHAKELAKSIGCELIDGSQINSLIVGHVWFGPGF